MAVMLPGIAAAAGSEHDFGTPAAAHPQQQRPMFPEPQTQQPLLSPPALAAPIKHCRQQPTLLVFQHTSATTMVAKQPPP